jgi:hypothetical protein
MLRTSRSRLPYQRLSQFPRLRALLAQLLSPKSQHRRRRTSRREIIQLLLIILGSIVAVIVGLYGGITLRTVTSTNFFRTRRRWPVKSSIGFLHRSEPLPTTMATKLSNLDE